MSNTGSAVSRQDFVRSFVEAQFDAQCGFLAEMVKVPTDNPPGNCAPHADVTAGLLRGLGLTVEVHRVPQATVEAVGMISATNLIVRASFGSGGPCIALNAHGDVVPPGLGWRKNPYGAEIEEDPVHGPVMYGRGVAVSKSDFATYTWALLGLQALAARGEKLNGSIELHLTYDEETGGDIGPRWIVEQGLTKATLAISAGFSYAVTTAHNGCLHLEVTVRGHQGHAAMPETGVDAIAAATKILSELYAFRARFAERKSKTTGINIPTLNVGLIEGGINTNVVPDKVTFRIDRRMIPEENPAEAEAELRAQLEASAAAIPGIRMEIRRVLLALPLVRLPGATPLIDALKRNGEAFFGTAIAEHGVPLYTDARHYTAVGIPTVLYGAGPRTLKEANGHNADENLRLRDLKGATQTVTCALADLLAGT
jgi:acetylornithine deacetylase/succinyl-diaminopimelate desuccinylase-like protein